MVYLDRCFNLCSIIMQNLLFKLTTFCHQVASNRIQYHHWSACSKGFDFQPWSRDIDDQSGWAWLWRWWSRSSRFSTRRFRCPFLADSGLHRQRAAPPQFSRLRRPSKTLAMTHTTTLLLFSRSLSPLSYFFTAPTFLITK